MTVGADAPFHNRANDAEFVAEINAEAFNVTSRLRAGDGAATQPQ
jgi:hypothetical protein